MQPTVADKELYALRGPSQLCHSRTDLFIQAFDSLLKQRSLFRLKAGDDSIVVPDDEHDVLPQHPELLTLLVDVDSIVGHLKSQSLPVVHLTKQLEQSVAEADLNQSSPEEINAETMNIGLHTANSEGILVVV